MIVAYGNPFGANLRLFGLVFDNKRQLFINGDINKKYRPKSSSNSFLFPPKPSPMKLLKSSTIILITSFSSDFGHSGVRVRRVGPPRGQSPVGRSSNPSVGGLPGLFWKFHARFPSRKSNFEILVLAEISPALPKADLGVHRRSDFVGQQYLKIWFPKR